MRLVRIVCFSLIIYFSVSWASVLWPFLISKNHIDVSSGKTAKINTLEVSFVDNANLTSEEFSRLIESKKSKDIIAINQINEDSIQVDKLKEKFPYIALSRTGIMGNALLASKLPIKNYKEAGMDVMPALIVELEHHGSVLNVAVCNLPLIKDKQSYSEGRMILRRIGTLMRHSKDNWLVSCNINGSIFSKIYRNFLKVSLSDNIRNGLGYAANKEFLKENILSSLDKKQIYVFLKGNLQLGSLIQDDISFFF